MRKAQAWNAIRRLHRIWKSKVLDRSIKINLFRALIESIFLYNATTWTINKSLSKKISGAYSKLLRYALNIHWTEKVTNIEVFQDIKPIYNQLLKRKLISIGHCWRSPQSAPQPISDLLFWEAPGKKRRGGNRSNYRKIFIDEVGLPEEDLKRRMEDRQEWRNYIKKICY